MQAFTVNSDSVPFTGNHLVRSTYTPLSNLPPTKTDIRNEFDRNISFTDMNMQRPQVEIQSNNRASEMRPSDLVFENSFLQRSAFLEAPPLKRDFRPVQKEFRPVKSVRVSIVTKEGQPVNFLATKAEVKKRGKAKRKADREASLIALKLPKPKGIRPKIKAKAKVKSKSKSKSKAKIKAKAKAGIAAVSTLSPSADAKKAVEKMNRSFNIHKAAQTISKKFKSADKADREHYLRESIPFLESWFNGKALDVKRDLWSPVTASTYSQTGLAAAVAFISSMFQRESIPFPLDYKSNADPIISELTPINAMHLIINGDSITEPIKATSGVSPNMNEIDAELRQGVNVINAKTMKWEKAP